MNRTSVLCGLAITTLLLAACVTPPPQSWEGLDLVAQQKFDAVYLRPDASFARYTEIMLDPLEVSFDRNWDPRAGTSPLTRVDTGQIRQVLADEFRRIFEEALTADGKYRLVTEAGPATLRISPAIVDLYINAPDVGMQSSARITSYTLEPGRMTLAAGFRDGASDTLLARVVDRKQGMQSTHLQVTNRVTNLADARRAMTQWARSIREGLDTARALAPADRH